MNKAVLVILDGFGEGPDYPGNAITRSTLKTIPELRKSSPWTLLNACGEAAGTPKGTQGGSEVGHFTIGAGRVVFQTYETINRAIRSGSFFTMPALLEAFEHVKNTEKSALHLLGMISDQGIHSHTDHLFALLELAARQKIPKIYIHAITDGRDVHERSAEGFIDMIEKKIIELGLSGKAKIGSLMGRYYAMDRDSNWNRLTPAYDMLTLGTGRKETDAKEAVRNAYARGVETDYYIEPTLLDEHATIRDKDAVVYFNFRTDRARELTWAFTGEKHTQKADTPDFVPKKKVRPIFICMGPYSEQAPVLFPTPVIINNLATVLADHNLKQFRIAETQKYAHVTYFFNSQIEEPVNNETRFMVESPKCTSYAEKPEMSAREVTDHLVETMESHTYDFIAANFANCDLVGHSGSFSAAVKAVETIDACLAKIVAAGSEHNYTIFITGDHGNIEYMTYEDGTPCPSHTKNPVPLFMCRPEGRKGPALSKERGELADIAPTILAEMGLEQPSEMTGKSLLQ